MPATDITPGTEIAFLLIGCKTPDQTQTGTFLASAAAGSQPYSECALVSPVCPDLATLAEWMTANGWQALPYEPEWPSGRYIRRPPYGWQERKDGDHRCVNSQRGSYGHECGHPAEWIGTKANGFRAMFCDHCKEHGDERHGQSWEPATLAAIFRDIDRMTA